MIVHVAHIAHPQCVQRYEIQQRANRQDRRHHGYDNLQREFMFLWKCGVRDIMPSSINQYRVSEHSDFVEVHATWTEGCVGHAITDKNIVLG